MKLSQHSPVPRVSASQRGFTLAEVLAALVFLAILIPVVAHGLSIASRAASASARRHQAALVAENVLNESIVTTNWLGSMPGGTIRRGNVDFRWTLRSERWDQDPNITTLRLLSAEVSYPLQGTEHRVTLSTLVQDVSTLTQSNRAW